MKSPFAIFRKHSKVLTVWLTVLAMFAFIVFSSLEQSQFPFVFGILLGAGIFWYIGSRVGKPGEYAVAGAVLGGMLVFFTLKDVGAPPPAVETSVGGLTRIEINQLIQKRHVANQFLREIFNRSNGDQSFMVPQAFGFGSATLEEDVLVGQLLRHEADELGVVVSNTAVGDFIHKETKNKLSTKVFDDLCREMRLSQSELFNILRDELKSRTALQMTYPRNLPTPQRYFQTYRKLNVRQQIDAVTIPVSAFIDDVPTPSDDELAAFFDEHSNVYANVDGPGEPGFRQPRKVRLAYLEADFETVEKDVEPVTDEEIEKYYDENKELFRNRPAQEEGPKLDESKPLNPQFAPDENGNAPVEAPKPQNPETSSTSQTSAIQLVSAEKPAEEKPAEEKPTEEKPATEKPATEKPAAEKPADEKPAAEKPSEAKPTEAKPTEDKPAAPALDEPVDGAESKTPLPEFRPLDDDLKDLIRDQLTSERAREIVRKIIGEQAHGFMYRLHDEYDALTEEGEETISEQEISERLKEYAASKNLRYVATDWLSQADLRDFEKHPIGSAAEPAAPGANPFQQTNSITVISQLFETPPDFKYSPTVAEDLLTHNWYAYWKIDDRSERVPTFKDPGVAEQVLEAWKQHQARPKAKKRADELAEIARNSKAPMSESLEGQSVTVEPDSPKVDVQQTESFGWLRESSAPGANPFQRPPPTLSTISAIEKVDDDFMQTLFEELSEGDVGVIPNADRTAYHVVRIKNRTSATKAGQDILRQTFLKEDMFFFFSPYAKLIQQGAQASSIRWRDDLMKKYDVSWKKTDESPEL